MDSIKIIAVLMLALVALTMLFGCTVDAGTDTNAPKVTNDAEASRTLSDASTDLSGVKQTLDDAENTLTE